MNAYRTTKPTKADQYTDAACVDDPEPFYPSEADVPHSKRNQAAIAYAKAICGRCSIRPLCLSDAMAYEVDGRRWGIAGGLTATERGRLARGGS